MTFGLCPIYHMRLTPPSTRAYRTDALYMDALYIVGTFLALKVDLNDEALARPSG